MVALIISIVLFLSVLGVIFYDEIKLQKILSKRSKLIVLRLNNAYVRSILDGNSFILCECTYHEVNQYLYTTDGIKICAFTEECTHLLRDAWRKNQEIVDCGISINRFVFEAQQLKKNDKDSKTLHQEQ